MEFNDYISTELPRAVQASLRAYAKSTPYVSRFYNPATGWFYTGTVWEQIVKLLSEFAVKSNHAHWLIMADQPYPLSVQKRYADVLIADPTNQAHYLMIEVNANMNLNDAISDADKLADYMTSNNDLFIEAYVFFLAIDEQMIERGIEAINSYIEANYSVMVTPIGTPP